MSNGDTSMETWVRDIDNKLDALRQSFSRLEAFYENHLMNVAENKKQIDDLEKEVQVLKEAQQFQKGEMKMLCWIGGVLVGIAVILQPILFYAFRP